MLCFRKGQKQMKCIRKGESIKAICKSKYINLLTCLRPIGGSLITWLKIRLLNKVYDDDNVRIFTILP